MKEPTKQQATADAAGQNEHLVMPLPNYFSANIACKLFQKEYVGQNQEKVWAWATRAAVQTCKAWEFIEEYADGGESCTDCRFSDQSGPGWVHICKLGDKGEATECPALPEHLYPEA
jgi:hypothetical protein